MEIVTATEIRKILKDKYKTLEYIWLFDKQYTLMPIATMKKFFVKVRHYKYRDSLFDCDDFALVVNAQSKLYFARELESGFNCAFGEAAMFHPSAGIHNQNIFIDDTKNIWLFEPQSSELFKAGQGEQVFYVRI